MSVPSSFSIVATSWLNFSCASAISSFCACSCSLRPSIVLFFSLSCVMSEAMVASFSIICALSAFRSSDFSFTWPFSRSALEFSSCTLAFRLSMQPSFSISCWPNTLIFSLSEASSASFWFSISSWAFTWFARASRAALQSARSFLAASSNRDLSWATACACDSSRLIFAFSSLRVRTIPRTPSIFWDNMLTFSKFIFAPISILELLHY